MIDDSPNLLPHSNEAEQAVLGSLLLDNGAYDHVGDLLTPESFYQVDHRAVYTTIAQLVMANRLADPVTVHEAGGHDLEYLVHLTHHVPSASRARHYATIVREREIDRELIRITGEGRDDALSNERAPTEKIDRLQTQLAKLQDGSLKTEPKTISEVMVANLDRYNDMADGKRVIGVKTGIGCIDRVLRGGLQGGRVYVIAARPSIGKSSLAEDIGVNVADGGTGVLFCSLEMPKEEVADRAVAKVGRVSYDRLQAGNFSDDDWAKIAEAAERFRDMPFWIDEQPGCTIMDLRSKAMRVKRQGLGLMIIDYVQLCEANGLGPGATRREVVGQVSRGVKRLAKELNIPIILLSQLNREVEKRSSPEPQMSDLREAGDLEQDADVIIFLWVFTESDTHTVIGATFGKNRQGKRHVRVGLHFEGDIHRWGESAVDVSPKKAEKPERPRKQAFD